jgi:TRAP-type mannitol/chloroaromatic compound transport system permease large subunit
VLAGALHRRLSWRVLDAAIRQTALVSAMVFFIFVGANVFSLVFRLLGGAEMVAAGASAVGVGSGYARSRPRSRSCSCWACSSTGSRSS